MATAKLHLTRQLDVVPSAILEEPITIIGAGAIGSMVTLNLAKMGFTDLSVIDFDEVSIENMNSQFYRFSDIGKPKVKALADIIAAFAGEPKRPLKIRAYNERYEGGSFPGIVITAVDSMAVRKLVWEEHKTVAISTKFIIDPRMSVEDAKLFCMNPMSPKDIASYGKTLYSDEKAVQERCTAKATMYTAGMLSGLVAKTVKDALAGKEYVRVAEWSIHNDNFKAWRVKQ